MIGYVVGVMTPDTAIYAPEPNFGPVGAATALTEIEIAALPTFSPGVHNQREEVTTQPKYEVGSSLNYFDSPVRILESKLFISEHDRVHKYRVRSLALNVAVNEKYWIPEGSFTALAAGLEYWDQRAIPPEKDMTDWEKDIWFQIRNADRATAEVLYHILEKGP
jgi:hypothetical protein